MKSIKDKATTKHYKCKIHNTPVTITKQGMFLVAYCNKCQRDVTAIISR